MTTPANTISGALPGQPDDYELAVFKSDVIFRWFRGGQDGPRARVRPPLMGLFFAMVLLVIAGTASALSGSFSQPRLSASICHDLSTILGHPKWSCIEGYQPSPQFSFLRDLPSMIVIAVVGLEPVLIYRQWLGFERLFPSMIRRQLIVALPNRENDLLAEVRRANNYLGRLGKLNGIMAAGAAVVTLPMIAAQRDGTYSLFRDGSFNKTSWHHDSYISWWANFYVHPVAWAVYTLVIMIGIYEAIIMNLVAIRPIIVIWRTRGSIRINASPDNEDGYFGWRQPREILNAGYVATALYGIAISCLSLSMTGNARWFVAPLVIQWIGVLPAHLYIPLSLTVRSIRRYKDEITEELTDQLSDTRALPGLQAEQARELLATRIQRVREIRTLPFRSLRDILAAVFLFVASLCSIYAAAGLWYHVS